MEPSAATGGNRWQMRRPLERLKQAKTVAVGCDQLPESLHGKEGVDGSSPPEGSAKVPQTRALCLGSVLQIVERGSGVEPFIEPSGPNAAANPNEMRRPEGARSARGMSFVPFRVEL